MHEADLKNETWKTVLSFPEYEASDRGRVRRKAYEDRDGRQRVSRILKTTSIHISGNTAANRMARGPYVRLRDNGLIYTVAVATLVYEAFNGSLDHRRYRIAFVNDDPSDVRLSNISIESRGEFSLRRGLMNRLRKLRGMVTNSQQQ